MMKQQLFALSFGLGALILATGHAFAQAPNRNCADRAAVIERLATKFGETRRSIGLAANNAVVETFASAESGSWTITVTLPSGLTCLVASGMAFEPVVEDLTPAGSPA